MNVLVTGGLGFIGSHLVEKLLELNYKVTIIDNLSSNVVEPSFFSKKCNTILDDLSKVLPNYNEDCNLLFHLASIVGPSGVLKFPGEIGFKLINDIHTIIAFAIKKQALLIDISTSEVYGHTNVLYENSIKIFPKEYRVRTEYGASKMVSEIMLENKSKVENRLKYHIIRPFNVTGIRQLPNNGFVLPRFVISVLTKQPITIFFNGNQVRAFTDVGDICDAILKITFLQCKNEIWNIGNYNNKITIKNLAFKVINKAKRFNIEDSDIIYIDPKKIYGELFSDVPDKLPNIDKLTTLTGWIPKYSLDNTIDNILDFYNNKILEGYYFDVMENSF